MGTAYLGRWVRECLKYISILGKRNRVTKHNGEVTYFRSPAKSNSFLTFGST